MKNEFKYENISGVCLELATKCNAMCSMYNCNFKSKIISESLILKLILVDVMKIMFVNFVK